MRIVSSGRSDVGMHREHNEDSYVIDPVCGLYIVCDGVGGHAAGEVASQQTVQLVQKALRRSRSALDEYLKDPTFEQRGEVLRIVESAIQEACARVYELAEQDPLKKGMGTTLAMMLALGDAAVIAHVGDSRVYIIRDNQVHQLTEDHSLAQELFRTGAISKDEMDTLPFSNVITRCVGSQPTVQVDTLFVECMAGDRFFLCSDGFHNYLEHTDEMLEMHARLSPDRLVEASIAMANERGGKDNITVIVAQVESVLSVTAEIVVEPGEDSVKRKIEILRHIRLFQQCTHDEMLKLLDIVRLRSFKINEVIIKEGINSDEVFILLLGKVQTLQHNEEILTLDQGAVFGETGLLEKVLEPATIKALEPTRVMSVRRRDFYALLEHEPELAVKMMQGFLLVLSQRVHIMSRALLDTRGTLATLSQEIRFLAQEEPETPC